MTAEPVHDLLVLRHGKASSDPSWPSDHARPLASRGERDAPLVGRFLADQGLCPDRVLCSSAARARGTADLVLQGLDAAGAPRPQLEHHDDLYLAPVPVLLGRLSALPEDCRRVLLVGHNPGLEELVGRLSGQALPAGDTGMGFPTCALAHLTLGTPWAGLRMGSARLAALRRPREAADA